PSPRLSPGIALTLPPSGSPPLVCAASRAPLRSVRPRRASSFSRSTGTRVASAAQVATAATPTPSQEEPLFMLVSSQKATHLYGTRGGLTIEAYSRTALRVKASGAKAPHVHGSHRSGLDRCRPPAYPGLSIEWVGRSPRST